MFVYNVIDLNYEIDSVYYNFNELCVKDKNKED
ncbi:hypothetical protein SAMN05192534_14116 [Alteribacillus persepolensis]|uniref:Uncharacterized protein n=1 Tax=Alteribacillus persepolensis TaxID=568899 RepID=A0A1G8GYH3_9BACI|nr:hypothetical protein SAMN05192534_11771 [Alteribacillus persepolensis]SDI38467.1 hypothetical protein SAMN05192534_14116 [Alteribacillus persepolensis]